MGSALALPKTQNNASRKTPKKAKRHAAIGIETSFEISEVNSPSSPMDRKSHRTKRKSKTSNIEEQRRASHSLNASAPICAPVTKHRGSIGVSYPLLPMEVSLLPEAARASSAPPGEEPAATTGAAPEKGSAWDFWGNLAPRSPCELHRVPEMELENFRRLVTKANLKADTVQLKRASSKRPGSADATPRELASAGEGMQWFESNIPYVPQRQPSMGFGDGLARKEYSFFGNMLDDGLEDGLDSSSSTSYALPDVGADTPASIIANAEVAASARRTSEDTAEYGYFSSTFSTVYSSRVADAANAKEKGEGATSEENPSHETRSHTSDLARRDTFGFRRPHGNRSVVIRQGGVMSFCKRSKRQPSTSPANSRPYSQVDFMDHFLMTADAVAEEGKKEEDGVRESGDASTQELMPAEPQGMPRALMDAVTDEIQYYTSAMFPLSSLPAASARAASPRSYPLPQPLMYGPRSAFTRSRRFDMEGLLGFRIDQVRRVPSPDWRRVEDGTAPHGHRRTTVPQPKHPMPMRQQQQQQQQVHSPRMNDLRLHY